MRGLFWLRNAVVLLVVFVATVNAAQTVPEVYRDEYIMVRASIPEIGLQPVHLGDALSMILELEFDGRQVRVEALDSDFFQRAYAKQKGIKLYAAPDVTQEDAKNGFVKIRATWPFQIMDCPDDFAICAGDKIYALPIITISYQLIDESGQSLNDKSVRFRPWPDKIAVSPTIVAASDPAETITDYFPGGAYPETLPIAGRSYAGLLAFISGSLILAIGVSNSLSRRDPRRHAAFSRSAAKRWERALAHLRSGSLPDDQWADLLRRAATWYCLDELECNPYTVPTSKATSAAISDRLTSDFHLFFVDVLQQQAVAPPDRGDYLSRFVQIAEATVGSGVLEDIA